MGIFDGKVALVTGAGGGLGRAYALLLAAEGAKVVVNDLGTNRHGEGEESRAADEVVKEIVASGGVARANYDSVASEEGAKKMVAEALDGFGGLDIVINNAGILRDKTLVKMEPAMWDVVMDVHLKGTFLVTQAAVRAMMRAGRPGRIVNTSSYAGLKGNFGQTNYGAAKAGIAGFTRSLALETRKFQITVNAIAPIAKTRMTEDIDLVPAEYGAADVAPLVLWLCSDEAADVTGRVFGAHGRHYFEYLVETTPGVEGAEAWTVRAVGEQFGQITQKASAESEGGGDEVRALLSQLPRVFDSERGKMWKATIAFDVAGSGVFGVRVGDGEATFLDGMPEGADGKVEFDSGETLIDLARGKLNPQKAFMAGKISTSNMDVLMKFAQYFDLEKAGRLLVGEGESLQESGAKGASRQAGPNPQAVGRKFKPAARFITPEEMEAYARAVDDEQPRYLQGAGDEQIGAPLFSVRPLFGALEAAMADEVLDADMLRLVHGEQEMRFFDVLRPWDLVTPRSEITAVEEKSSGWLIDVTQRLYRDGELVVEARSGLFVRKPKDKSGGSKSSKASAEREEPGPVLYEEEQTVAEDQPLRYAEASGDKNPIHVDKDVARSAGLPDVILHGLCTMAFAARAVVNGVLDRKSENLARIRVRFARPVLPGTVLSARIFEGKGEMEYGFEMVDEEGHSVLTQGQAWRR